MSTVAALLLIAPAFVAAGPRIAVLPLADGAQAAAVDQGIRAALNEIGVYEVQVAQQTRTHVRDASDMGVTCEPTDSFCARKLAVLAEVQFIIAPRVIDSTLTLRLLDVSQTDDGREASRPIAYDVPLAARQTMLLLHDPASGDASLNVDVTPPGVVVALDGVDVGPAPLTSPLTGLAPGRHIVSARGDGYLPGEVTLDVGFGETGTVKLELLPVPAGASTPVVDPSTTTPVQPPIQPEAGGLSALATTGLIVAGVGGAALALGLAAGGTGEVLADSEVKKLQAKDGTGSLADAEAFQLSAQIGWIVAIAAGAIVTVGGAIFGVAILTE